MTQLPLIDVAIERLPDDSPLKQSEPMPPASYIFMVAAWNRHGKYWRVKGERNSYGAAVIAAERLAYCWTHRAIVRIPLGMPAEVGK